MQQSLTFLHLNVDKYHLSNTDGSDKTVLALEVIKLLALNFTEAFFFWKWHNSRAALMMPIKIPSRLQKRSENQGFASNELRILDSNAYGNH